MMDQSTDQRLWVIIPAHNEEKNIEKVVQKVKNYTDNVLVVDDGSADKTFQLARLHTSQVLRHAVNMGKGAAAKTGCDYAIRHGAKKLILLDGDGQHNPDDIPRFLKALEENDIVFGYRKFSKDMPLLFRVGNTLLNTATKILYHINLKDTQCGYRAFTDKAYENIRWESSNYSMESEMIANAGKSKLKSTEVLIETIYQDRYKGTTLMDGIRIMIDMIAWRLK